MTGQKFLNCQNIRNTNVFYVCMSSSDIMTVVLNTHELEIRAYSHHILRWLRDISVKCNPRRCDPVSFSALRGCFVAYMSRLAYYTKLYRVLLQCS